MKLRILLSLFAIFCAVGPAQAQTESSCLAIAAEELDKNQLITVVGRDSSITVGLLQSIDLSRNFLTIDVQVGREAGAAFETQNFPLMNISMITAQRGKGIDTPAWLGALIGAGVGVAASAAFGADAPGTYVPGLLLGAALGGWIGYELQPDPPPLILECN